MRKERKEVQTGGDRQLIEDFVRVAETEAGRNVLRYLMRTLGYQRPSITQDPQSQEINPIATIYNEARRNIWLEIRGKIPHPQLVLIENPQPHTKEWIDTLLDEASQEEKE